MAAYGATLEGGVREVARADSETCLFRLTGRSRRLRAPGGQAVQLEDKLKADVGVLARCR
jgi:hypothetical protein